MCTSRTIIWDSILDSSVFPCGFDYKCVLDDDNSSCVESCSNMNHYETVNGRCKLKSCSDWTSDNSDYNPCGQNCVLNESNGECQSGCFENYVSNEKGACVKKENAANKSESNSEDFLCLQ
jgi:hypothetical protein